MSGTNGSISALELELEEDAELRADDEFGAGDAELDDAELDDELEADDELEEDAEWEFEADDGESDDYELGDEELVEPDRRGFAERFYELSLREGESELELAHEVDTILREMEREYFLKGLLKKVGGARKLIGKVAKVAGGVLPIGNVAKIATSLASGDMRGLLGSLANTALSVASKHPALAAAMPALKALGFGNPAAGKLPWQNFASMAKDAFGQLAKNVDQEAMTPVGAQRAARGAFNTALVGAARRSRSRSGSQRAAAGAGRKRVVTLRRGERLIVRVR
jgi:hypothetical protein